jgi:hypothetical protein
VARPQEFDAAEALHRALGVFWKKGDEASSLADLMAATGLGKNSLYATFGGQADGSVKSTRGARKLVRLLVVAFPGFQVMVRAGADRSRLEDAPGPLLANLD